MYSNQKFQNTALIADKALVTILVEYPNFEDMFSKKSAVVLSEHTEIDTHTIDLEEDKEPLYRPIYNLDTVELEILKTYIETNLANGFICLLISPTSALILFDKKFDKSHRLYIDYRGLNNIIIKNRYPLLLVKQSLDYLGHAK